MSDPNAPLTGRVWPGVVEVLVGFMLLIGFVLGAEIPALLWIQENVTTTPEEFAAAAMVIAFAGLLATSWVARAIVRGRTYSPEQRMADELRHAELFGPQWHYNFLKNMTPDEAARYERSRRWTSRIFILSVIVALPAGILFSQPILCFIPAAVLGASVVLTYWRAQSA